MKNKYKTWIKINHYKKLVNFLHQKLIKLRKNNKKTLIYKIVYSNEKIKNCFRLKNISERLIENLNTDF